jgi:ABC-type glutathione transport system ATPase component
MIGSYPDAVRRPGTLRPAHPAVVELAGVEKTSRSGRIKFRALSGVDLAIAAAEMVPITGPPGSGKTTGPLRRGTRIQPGTALRYQP